MSALTQRTLLAAVVLAAATSLSLSEGVGVVSGRVTDERGVPMNGVVVVLTSPGVLGSMQAVTNEDGRYWFPAVPGNHPLTIRAQAPDRVPVEYVGHTARRNGSIAVDFRLRKPGDYEILVLLEDGIPYLRTALDGARSTMPGRMTVQVVEDTGAASARRLREQIAGRPSAVLAFGETAALLARRNIRDIPVVYSMVPEPLDAGLTTANMCGVPLNGGFARQMAHLVSVMPDARRIGTVYNANRMDRTVGDLKQAVEAAGLELVAAHVHDGPRADLPPVLEELAAGNIDAFVLLLDPDLIDAQRFEEILTFAQREDILLMVQDPSLVVTDTSVAVVPGFWDLGAYTGTLVRSIVEGTSQPADIGMSYPDSSFLASGASPRHSGDPWEVLPGDEPDPSIRLASDE